MDDLIENFYQEPISVKEAILQSIKDLEFIRKNTNAGNVAELARRCELLLERLAVSY